jgi:hypothetical protein
MRMDHRHPNEDKNCPCHSLRGNGLKIRIPGRNSHTNGYLNSTEAIPGRIFDLGVTLDAHGSYTSN